MRHLTNAFTVGALRRGRCVEQILGACEVNEHAGVRWIVIQPIGSGFEVILHEVLDLDEMADLYEFPPLAEHDEQYFGQVLGRAADENEAMALAARHGADHSRWVNQGMAGEEYHDFVRARRRDGSPGDGPVTR